MGLSPSLNDVQVFVLVRSWLDQNGAQLRNMGGGCGPGDLTWLDRAMSPRKIGVTEVALRDAHQSLMATRMAMEDMVNA